MSQTAPPILSVVPSRALVDEEFKVVVENLPPGSPVTLHSLHHSEDKNYWEAYGHYISDHRGMVSVAEDLSLGGTYTGKEAMGLLWSMRTVPGSREGLRLRKRDVCSPMVVNISVHDGHIAEGFREQPPLTSVLVERWYISPGVQRIDIREKGLQGTLFIPPGPGPFPGLLDIWGGSGGLSEYRSSLLASHGFASLTLKYLSPDGQDLTGLEFSYFETAFNILRDHPQVIPDRIGIFGLSLGSILTIFFAAESTVIKPFCCVCISGVHLSPPGNSIKGLGQGLVRHPEKIRMDENNHLIWRDMAQVLLQDPSNEVDVGKINCPMLLVNGHDDQNLPAVESAEKIAQKMNAAGKGHLLTRLEYPGTGHLIEPPFSPHFRATNLTIDLKKTRAILLWGGQTKPHSDAQEDSWRKILAFLHHHLYSSWTPKARM
ncbi:bile acid-CoA:amino acid N-acyltransferase-like [Chelmon rostratus]|uniref:bile acid-CoA:amino acid N-acyltransferase-like n=1 Tax=Chelmon rostratus TaxID=109905 RepID=UPI001BE76670|nr:bile acid-CoA:amino acid N-acyltransferase-like [Chelmon rostratus]XP_041819703.1 bile acid-CoA:amino acid N-acyltransferase-like [Chelmon rostratus]